MKGTNSHERERLQPELTGSAEQLNVRNGGQSRLSAHAALDKVAREKVSVSMLLKLCLTGYVVAEVPI